MQVADIISWSLGGFACFHKREVALHECVCVCVCVCVLVCLLGESEQEREKKISNKHIKKFSYSSWFRANKTFLNGTIPLCD